MGGQQPALEPLPIEPIVTTVALMVGDYMAAVYGMGTQGPGDTHDSPWCSTPKRVAQATSTSSGRLLFWMPHTRTEAAHGSIVQSANRAHMKDTNTMHAYLFTGLEFWRW